MMFYSILYQTTLFCKHKAVNKRVQMSKWGGVFFLIKIIVYFCKKMCLYEI